MKVQKEITWNHSVLAYLMVSSLINWVAGTLQNKFLKVPLRNQIESTHHQPIINPSSNPSLSRMAPEKTYGPLVSPAIITTRNHHAILTIH